MYFRGVTHEPAFLCFVDYIGKPIRLYRLLNSVSPESVSSALGILGTYSLEYRVASYSRCVRLAISLVNN
jgi:hypothetical protein